MRAVGGDEVQFDPTSRPRQQGLGPISHDGTGHYSKRRGGLDRDQQHDRTQGVDRQNIFHDGLTGFEVDGAMKIQTVPPTALFDSDGRSFGPSLACSVVQQPTGLTASVGCTASTKTPTSSAANWFSKLP
jgi:hypothetical protein